MGFSISIETNEVKKERYLIRQDYTMFKIKVSFSSTGQEIKATENDSFTKMT